MTGLVVFLEPSADGSAVSAVVSKTGKRILIDGDATDGCNGGIG